MPDLVTHGCAGLLLGFAVAWRRPAPRLALFVAGNLLPDLLTRVPAILMGEIDAKLRPLPPLLLYGWEPMHQPAGMALAALGLTLLLPPQGRGRAFLLLYAGMLLHLLMDMFQFHEGAGHMLFFPLWTRPFEIGWFSSEASVLVAGPLAGATAAAWWWRRRARATPPR
ncbi:metal-dependent hydrolase [Myxococcota bacterium]|nr:metal-dependent hydrolase [Myxococcota bacterium]